MIRSTTQLPPDELNKCPMCQSELNALTDVVEARFPDSRTNPAGIAQMAAAVLTLGWYHEGILHQRGHPVSLAAYSMSLKEDQVPVSKLNDCRTCQDERTRSSHRTDYFYPGFAANPEKVQPVALSFFSRVMYWLGILHELDHPVSLTDYAESIKTGDFFISPPPPGEASGDR